MEHPENLSGNELNFLIGESEAFSSDDYVPFLEDLKEQDDKYGTINPRENLLMQGCLLKEQEIRNLINLETLLLTQNNLEILLYFMSILVSLRSKCKAIAIKSAQPLLPYFVNFNKNETKKK